MIGACCIYGKKNDIRFPGLEQRRERRIVTCRTMQAEQKENRYSTRDQD
jgi:hypothetical protein